MVDSAMPRALVTGATGFVGSHLVDDLIRKGWEVHSLLRTSAQGDDSRQLGHRHIWDDSTDGLLRIMSAARPDTVFHLASLFLAQHRSEDVVPLVESNVRLGGQLLEAMSRSGVDCLVYAGTSWQHFENKPYSPVCLYAATKQAFADILRYYTEAASIRAVTLTLYDTYGPGDRRPKLFSMLRQAASNTVALEMSPGEQLLDLVYIDDVVAAFEGAHDMLHSVSMRGVEEFAVTSGRAVPLKEVVACYTRVTGKMVNINWGGRPYRAREVMVPWNCGRILPGWRAEISLEEGIRRMEAPE